MLANNIFWVGKKGYQGAPEVEEQRLTDAYEAGYEDGKNNNFDSVDKHKG
jgi:hypothetical protein